MSTAGREEREERYAQGVAELMGCDLVELTVTVTWFGGLLKRQLSPFSGEKWENTSSFGMNFAGEHVFDENFAIEFEDINRCNLMRSEFKA